MEFYGTLGASCAREEILTELFHVGMTGARLNLSHTSLAGCAPLLAAFWSAARRTGTRAHLIIDLQGPELRVGRLERPVLLEEGAEVRLGPGGVEVPGAVVTAARPGDRIALDDSAMLLEVEGKRAQGLLCRVLRGGALQSRKSLALLGHTLDTSTLTREDLDNLSRARDCGVTHVLQPFVRGREDILLLRRAMEERGLGRGRIMAKIENRQGIDRLEEIMEEADMVCIARGDLGNSMPLWELPGVQKELSRRCRQRGKPFFVVTQLLYTMQERPVPTRAEVSDIYNAVLDGSQALMLTGETAVGRYPVQAMEYLVKTARQAELAKE